jgi:DNA-binding response OmpR family regulator
MSLLQVNGYELATATNGTDGLRLFMSQPVDAVVIEYYIGFLDAAAVTNEIKQFRPEIPIVMLADRIELPADALAFVDALVVQSDGPHFLLATLNFVLHRKPALSHKGKGELRSQTPAHLWHQGRPQDAAEGGQPILPRPFNGRSEVPFSREVWRDIRNGTIRF